MKNKIFVLIIITAFLCGCASTRTTTRSWQFSTERWNNIEAVPALLSIHFKDSEEKVVSALGAPDEKTVHQEDSSVQWNYFHDGVPSPKIIIVFDLKSKTVAAKSYLPIDNDKYNTFPDAKSIEPNAKLKIKPLPAIRDHSPNTQQVFADEALGFGIEINKYHNDVEFISWYTPKNIKNRTPSKAIW